MHNDDCIKSSIDCLERLCKTCTHFRVSPSMPRVSVIITVEAGYNEVNKFVKSFC